MKRTLPLPPSPTSPEKEKEEPKGLAQGPLPCSSEAHIPTNKQDCPFKRQTQGWVSCPVSKEEEANLSKKNLSTH